MSSLEERLHTIQAAAGWSRNFTISEMLDSWRAFIDQCEDSYDWSIYEYEDDLSIRDRIELVLGTTDLRTHPAVRRMAKKVEQLDQRFRQLLLKVSAGPKGEAWWRQGVLKYAGEEYAKDAGSLYGVKIEVR